MKKLLSIILALSFILCAGALSSFAATTKLWQANTGWNVVRGEGMVWYDDARDVDFYWKADANGKTWDWPVFRNDTMEEGTITAKISASGNIGIFFGALGIENVSDAGGKNLTTAVDTRYSWIALEVAPDTGAAVLKFYHDDDTAAGVPLADNILATVALNDTPENATKYGIDGSSDVELKVEFTMAGKVVAYVNGVETITKEGVTLFGTQYGMIIRSNTTYGTAKANTEVGYVKNFNNGTSAPDTGDFTNVYVIASTVILAATFAVVCISRKKRIAE